MRKKSEKKTSYLLFMVNICNILFGNLLYTFNLTIALPFYQPLTFFCTVLWPVCPCLHMKNIISLIMNIVIRCFSLRSHLSTSLSYLPFYQSLTFFGTDLWTVLFTYEYHILFDILPITRLS